MMEDVMEKMAMLLDSEELKAQPYDEDYCDTEDSLVEIKEVASFNSPDEDAEVVETNHIVRQRLDFVDQSLLFGQQSHCPCSYPWQRFVSKNRALHFLIPITGLLAERHPARCSLHASPSYTQTWLPPRWLEVGSLQLGISWPSKFRPRVSCKKTRRIPDDAECFEAAKTGDIEKVRELLASGTCRLEDNAFSTGYTMLTWAVMKLEAKMVEFLVETGANPHHDVLGIQPSPSHLAWDLWLRGLIPKNDEPMMRSLLDKSNYVDELVLPIVHQIILDMSSESLDDVMQLDPAAIHFHDSQERNALSWAVACGRRRCLARFLNGGADPSIADKHSKTPLYLAVEYETDHTFDIVRALLSAGADTDPILPHPQRSTPLLCAAENVKDLRIIHMLLSEGANVNAKNRYGRTALHIVARNKPAEHAALLLSYGARIHVKDQNGKTALDIAIKHGNVDVLRLLMLLFYPIKLSDWLEDIGFCKIYFQNIIARWDHERPPQFFPRPGTGYMGPEKIGFPTVNAPDLKKAQKQLHREYGILPDLPFDQLLNSLGYRRQMGSIGNLDSIKECIEDSENGREDKTIDE